MKLLKASAGSGKTYNLAKQYIELLLRSTTKHPHRHILAVTFTNASTAEMKSRILDELRDLAQNPLESNYYADFLKAGLCKGEQDMKDKAGALLSDILHDYRAFSVSTIDSFFQQTLKAFAREIGQFSSYQIELDTKSLYAESVDRLLDSLSPADKQVLGWLTDSAIDQVMEEGKVSIDKSLNDMAARLQTPEYRNLIKAEDINQDAATSKTALSNLKKRCREIISDFYKQMSERAQAVVKGFNADGIELKKTTRGFMEKIHDFVDITPVKSIPNCALTKKAPSEPSDWFKKDKEGKMLAQTISPTTVDAVNNFFSLFRDADSAVSKEYSYLCTARIVEKQICALGVMAELSKSLQQIMKEKNVLAISDTDEILQSIIANCDAPFIYEKTGTRYEHFLLDEFQDTSRVQWENIFPLLIESTSRGFENLVVGDVKQSIYRWRNSDWKMLNGEVEAMFPGAEVKSLDTNFRSLPAVVNFNNELFTRIAPLLDNKYGLGPGSEFTMTQIYSDVKQECKAESSGGPSGKVELTWCEAADMKANVISAIQTYMTEAGAKYSDIAIIVRSGKTDGRNVSKWLIEENIPVVTTEALSLKSSQTISRLVALMTQIDNPQDKISGFMVDDLGIELPTGSLSLVDLAENLLDKLSAVDTQMYSRDVAYIQTFMDYLQDYAAINGNDLRGFLKKWKNDDISISSSGGNSVKLITIHKSKGLQFKYVIIPFADSIEFYKASHQWCLPSNDNPVLKDSPKMIFDVNLSSETEKTAFSESYHKEWELQAVDALNMLYVALTRPERAVHIISPKPSKEVIGAKPPQDADEAKTILPIPDKFNNMSALLHYLVKTKAADLGLKEVQCEGKTYYTTAEFTGYIPKKKAGKSGREIKQIDNVYCVNPIVDRVEYKADGADFFAEDGLSFGFDASHRLRGVILHDILAKVKVPADLENAIAGAVRTGMINKDQAADVRSLLSDRIASARARGWFPDDPSKVKNEVSLIDVDGSVRRPDRVVELEDGSLVVIDYKFGEKNDKYSRQVGKYAAMLRAMGHKNVFTCLWYLNDDELIYGE